MTKDEQIEQLEMEKRVLITKLVKAQDLLRVIADARWPNHEDLTERAKALYLELRE